MTIDELLKSQDAQRALAGLAKAYDIDPAQLDVAVDKIVPALSNRIERNTLSRGGVADLMAELMKPQHARVLADPSVVTTPEAAAAGVGALDTIFGDKASSRSLAAQTAVSSGSRQAIIQKLLPIIASLVMAALSKGSQGGLGEILKKLPDLAGAGGGGGSGGTPGAGRAPRRRDDSPEPPTSDGGDLGGIGDILRKLPGFPQDGSSGSPQMPGPAPSRRVDLPREPEDTSSGGSGGGDIPMPGDTVPGINGPRDSGGGNSGGWGRSGSGQTGDSQGPGIDLPDVIRRGQTVDGGSLGTLIRNVLGSILGFQSKGFIGWAFRLILLRWGWGFLQRILGRVLTGR